MSPPEGDRWQRRARQGVLLSLALAVLSLVGLTLWGGGLGVVGRALGGLPPYAIALVVLGVATEWIADAARFAVAGRMFGLRAPWSFWLKLALVNLAAAYAANVGPAASAWLLTRRGMKGGEALALSVAKQMMFFPAALAPVCVIAIVAPGFVPHETVQTALRGLGIAGLFAMGVLLVLARSPSRALAVFTRLSKRGHAPAEGFLLGLRRFFFERPRELAASLALGFVNQGAIVAMLVGLLHALGADASATVAWGRSFLFSTLSQTAPTPGAAGVADVSGVLLFQSLLEPAALAAYLLIARFATIQLPILAGGMWLARDLERARRGD